MAAAVLERIAQGEAAAFAACVDTYGALVWSLARRFSPTPADAEDATQEIFLHLWKSASRYDAARGTEAVFIATLARRLLIDRHRERRRRPVEVVVDEIDNPWGATDDVDGAMSADAQLAATAMQRLKPDQQRVITLSIVEGLSQSEIATATGMPLGTVKTLMRRGLLEVRALLGGSVQS
jgi:RNA polymerase sigma-70 factor, ECF subfamily